MASKGYRFFIRIHFIVVLSLFCCISYAQDSSALMSVAQEERVEKAEFNAGNAIIHHVLDAHEFHFFSIGDFHASLPLPVILYSPAKGVDMFLSSKFGHAGHLQPYKGYRMVDEHYIDEQKALGVDSAAVAGLHAGSIVAEDGSKVYDLSITKNVAQMLLSAILLILIMTSVAKSARRNGPKKAPTGLQNLIEPVITFVRDDIARPNLYGKHNRYMPFLLTLFFFILINNLMGLIPGAANSSGNIAFTGVLALIAFVYILISTNKEFWAHTLWAPGIPVPVKLILAPVELLSLLIKPAALMIRLFANMTAGHIIILSFISLIFIFGNMSTVAGAGFAPVSIAFAIFMYCIELLVAFIQAFIFTMLTAVFIGQSIEPSTHGDHAHAHDDKHEIAAA